MSSETSYFRNVIFGLDLQVGKAAFMPINVSEIVYNPTLIVKVKLSEFQSSCSYFTVVDLRNVISGRNLLYGIRH